MTFEAVTIDSLVVEHHESGFAIGTPRPRLSWRFAPTLKKDWHQASYEVVINRGPGSDQEETYRFTSSDSVLVPWPSRPLVSRERAQVRVRSTGKDGSMTNWASLSLEAALLSRDDWHCSLISGPSASLGETKRPIRFRKPFHAPGKFSNARLYATAHGVYELELNGKRVGDHVLAPGWQSYAHHLNYQTYDVTSLVVPDEVNVLGAYVGEGWYAGRLVRNREIYGNRLALLAQLEIDDNVAVLTDNGWEWLHGPVLSSELYDGEAFDSRHQDRSWSTKDGVTATSSTQAVEVLPFPNTQLISPDAPPVRRIEYVTAKDVIITPSGKVVLDFGQNLVGWLKINRNIEGADGSEISLRHAEVMEHGELGTRPLRTAKARDIITLGGDVEGWEPRFTFHGFRYAEINGFPGEVKLTDFTAVVISSDLRRTGFFECSHPMVNRLHENVVWGMKGNFLSVPTDCPQRDERLGWTGDIQIFAPTANFLYDTSGFLRGWLKDVAVETEENEGVPPVVVPNVFQHRGKPDPHAVWADVVALLPRDLYTSYADKDILEEQFATMTLWLERGVPRRSDGTGLWAPDAIQFGDWLDPRAPPQYPANGQTDTHLVANAYLVYVTGVVATTAKLLKRHKEAQRFDTEYAKLKLEFQREYVTPNGRLASDSQTAYALALSFNLLPPESRPTAIQRLDWLIRYDTFKISTGFAGTPLILHALANADLLHLAYRMLQEKEDPSWLYAVRMGATTVWERWNSIMPDGTVNPGQMTSMNHYALGSVASFLHAVVGGISPTQPGWKEFLVRPRPGGTITSADVKYSSAYGLIRCSWNIDKHGKLNVNVTVPPNTSAHIVLPGLDEVVGSGEYYRTTDWSKDKNWPPIGIKSPGSVPIRDEFIP